MTCVWFTPLVIGQQRKSRHELVVQAGPSALQPSGPPRPRCAPSRTWETRRWLRGTPSDGPVRRMGFLAFSLLEVLGAGMGPARMTAKAFSAGYHRMVHRACPAPLGSMPRVTTYNVFSAACSVGK